jgi:hypothetical protein
MRALARVGRVRERSAAERFKALHEAAALEAAEMAFEVTRE